MVTLYILGIDSALSMLDATKQGIMDFKAGKRHSRSAISSSILGVAGGSYELCNTVLAVIGLFVGIVCNFKYGLILWDRWDF